MMEVTDSTAMTLMYAGVMSAMAQQGDDGLDYYM